MAIITTDPIADMLTRIRNSIAVNKNEVSLPHSNMKERVAKLLKDHQLLESVETVNEASGIEKTLKIVINKPDTNAKINEIVRLSKPGRRLYTRADKMPKVKNGRGFVVVSTSQGLMTSVEAKQKGIGGELICKVY